MNRGIKINKKCYRQEQAELTKSAMNTDKQI